VVEKRPVQRVERAGVGTGIGVLVGAKRRESLREKVLELLENTQTDCCNWFDTLQPRLPVSIRLVTVERRANNRFFLGTFRRDLVWNGK
jgi:predicted nicotinamide N-methyase